VAFPKQKILDCKKVFQSLSYIWTIVHPKILQANFENPR